MTSKSSDSSSSEYSLLIGDIIDEYKILQKIGEGGFGQIYEVIHQTTMEHYGMKIEYLSTHRKGLKKEIAIMKEMPCSFVFPKFISEGQTSSFRYLIMELLGPSLSQLYKMLPTRALSPYTLLHLSIQMIRSIQALHEIGYIHRDIKPGNFLIRPERKYLVSIIDFGLSHRYLLNDGRLKKPRHRPGYVGTYRFASFNALENKELSRRDDLFSWFYSIVELAQGRLPWTSEDKNGSIKMKKEIKADDLCEMLPSEFKEIYNMISTLHFTDRPDYDGIVGLIQTAIKSQHFASHKFDWELLSEDELAQISVISLEMEKSTEFVKPPDTEKPVENETCCNIS